LSILEISCNYSEQKQSVRWFNPLGIDPLQSNMTLCILALDMWRSEGRLSGWAHCPVSFCYTKRSLSVSTHQVSTSA